MTYSLKKQLSDKRTRLVCALVALILGAACLIVPHRVSRLIYLTSVNEWAAETLDQALTRNMTAFLAISAIKSGMAIVEGSSVGVGFELELGDVIQPAYDYVNFVWEMFLYAMVVLGFYKLLLETGFLELGLPILGLGLLLWAGTFARPDKFREKTKTAARRCVLFGLLFAYIVPVTLLGTAFLNAHYTAPLKDKYYRQIQTFSIRFDQAKADFVALKDSVSITNPSASIDEVKAKLARIGQAVSEALRGSLSAFLYYVVLLMFELLLFPLITALLLHRIVRTAIGSLFQSRPLAAGATVGA